jgi:hypothetical protein
MSARTGAIAFFAGHPVAGNLLMVLMLIFGAALKQREAR